MVITRQRAAGGDDRTGLRRCGSGAGGPAVPLFVSVALSQAYMATTCRTPERNFKRGLQARHRAYTGGGGPRDPAFRKPTKPIRAFMTGRAEKLAAETGAQSVMEDAGRGWRKVVKPQACGDSRSGFHTRPAGRRAIVVPPGGGYPSSGRGTAEEVPLSSTGTAAEKLAGRWGRTF